MRAPPAPPAWASSLTSVGVTGTNGKTSTTGMVAALLGLLCRPVARVTTLGCFLEQERLDVPPHYEGFLETMRRCRDAAGRYAALELTSEALALGFANAWPCRVGVFTNLSLDHSDAHGSPEHYLAAKAQLFLSLAPGGYAVLNACDESAQLVSEVVPKGVELLHYGVASRGRAWAPLELAASGIEPSLDGTRATLEPSVRFPDLPGQLELRASGAIFVENALGALGAALALGVPAVEACAALAALPPPPGRFQVLSRSPDVVVDYAHTPDALERTLVTARALCRGTLTLVFGAGGDRDKLKRPLLGAAAAAADRVVLTSDNPRSERPEAIMDDIAAGLPATCSVLREVDRERAIERAIAAAETDDLVLIAGKGHENSQEVRGQRLPFSDVAIVRRSTKTAQ